MSESLHNWVLRDSCLRRNDGNWDCAKVSDKRGYDGVRKIAQSPVR